jgi:hypothetical protein
MKENDFKALAKKRSKDHHPNIIANMEEIALGFNESVHLYLMLILII